MPWERDVDVRLLAQHLSPRRVADGNQRPARGTRDGALFTSDWLQALVIEGRGFCAGIGLLSAGEVLQGAAITTLRPSLWLRVPTGVSILPFFGGVQIEDSGSTAFEVAIGIVSSDVGEGTSSAADYGPVNLKTNGPATLGVIARQEATADVSADPDNDLWRFFTSVDTAAEADASVPPLIEWKPKPSPLLVGPASLVMSIGSAAAETVTAQLQWVEFETNEIA